MKIDISLCALIKVSTIQLVFFFVVNLFNKFIYNVLYKNGKICNDICLTTWQKLSKLQLAWLFHPSNEFYLLTSPFCE